MKDGDLTSGVFFGDYSNDKHYRVVDGNELREFMFFLEQHREIDGSGDWHEVFWGYIANGHKLFKKING